MWCVGSSNDREELLGEKPDVTKLQICYCVARHHIPKAKQRNKLEMRVQPVIGLGYAQELIAYRLQDLTTSDLIKRRSVT